VVPDTGFHVTIPSGCSWYPVLSGTLAIKSPEGSYSCKNLLILAGGSIHNSGELSLSGEMNVSGVYIATNNTDNTQNIYASGILLVDSAGMVKLGNQTSGDGYCDLVIHGGGTLIVHKGTLDIDDQLNVNAGGTFNMTKGTVFVNKFGKGSDYDITNPGAFYIAPGASGIISGGIIKVCGKTTTDTLTAINIGSPGFDFTGTSTLEMVHGDNPVHYDADIKTVPGATLQNLVINKTDKTVRITSDVSVNGKIVITPQSTLRVMPGNTVTVADSVIIQH
jgi:hypothetical protein